MHRSPWLAAAACSSVLLAGATASLTAGPAAADELYPLTAATSIGIVGHGWGHGHGLSQYGAQGAAKRGIGAGQILATYYPGTAAGTTDEGPIRVLVQDDDGVDLQVAPAAGLAVRDNNTNIRYVLPPGPARWRLVNAPDGLHVQGGDGVNWGANWVPPGGPPAFTGSAQFDGPDTERVFLPGGVSRDYRGWVVAVRGPGTSLSTVNTLWLEWYLYGVVPRESPSSFLPAALQAQAVAARTYSAYKRAHAGGAAWDICSSTQCQVYGGRTFYAANGAATALEVPSTNAAVDVTAAQVRLWNGAPAFTEFSATNGGWSTDGGTPYLAANADPWDDNADNPLHNWSAVIEGAKVQAAFPQVGTLSRLRVTARDGNGDWGGRVRAATLEGVGAGGVPTSVPVTGDDLRIRLGLRSTFWHPTQTAIQAKYGALGGPGGLLGAPVTAELPTPDRIGAFTAYERGAIYWSAPSGAWEVHGAIRDHWAALGWEAGRLGYPVTDEQTTPDGTGRFNHFQGGSVYWSPTSAAAEVHGAIRDHWAALGWEKGSLGYPLTDEQVSPDGAGRYNLFQGGSVYWSPTSAVAEVHGAIRDHWAALGAQGGLLGYPMTDELRAPDGMGRYNVFQGGSVYWSPTSAVAEVHGAIRDLWLGFGAERGLLGYPLTDEADTLAGGGRFNLFQRASVYWSPATGTHEVHGAIRDRWVAGGSESGPLGLPRSNEYPVPGGARSDFVHGSIQWDAATGTTAVTIR